MLALTALLSSSGLLFDLNGTHVFTNGLAGVENYRIPAIVQAGNGRLVAFAEARNGGDNSASRIATRWSDDGGQTWSPVTFAAGHEDSPTWRMRCNLWGVKTDCRAGNPAAVYNASSGEVVLVYVLRGFDQGGDDIGNGMTVSSDGGETWKPPTDVSGQWGAAASSMPGPGTALILEAAGGKGPAGRLLVASHHGAYTRDYVTYSDDRGATWHLSNTSFPKMDEAAITQLPNGSVLINMRHTQSPKLGRATALSDNGGESFGPILYDRRLVSPVCQASIVSFGGATYFSNPASSSGRTHLTVRRSLDSTATWGGALLVQGGHSSGYSCLVKGALQNQKGKGGRAGDGSASARVAGAGASAGVEESRAAEGGSVEGGLLYEATDSSIKFGRFPLALFDALEEA